MRGWGQTDKRERGPCCPCWLVVSLHGDEPLASCAHRGSCCPAAPTWAPLCSGSICFPACPSFSRPSLLPPSRRTSQFPTLQRGVGLGKRFACVFSLSTSWVILQNHFGLLSGLYFLCFFLSLSLKLRSTESLWFFGVVVTFAFRDLSILYTEWVILAFWVSRSVCFFTQVGRYTENHSGRLVSLLHPHPHPTPQLQVSVNYRILHRKVRGAIPFWPMECNFNLTARTRTELTGTKRADLWCFAVKCWYWSDTNKPDNPSADCRTSIRDS